MCVLLLSPAHSAQTFFLGRTRICCWPFRPIQCNADAWQSDVLNHCVLSGGCLPKSYVKRWVICKRLLEERLLTLVQDNKSYPNHPTYPTIKGSKDQHHVRLL